MDRSRQRYNARARQSTAGSHKKKGKRKSKQIDQSEQPDPNAEIVMPKMLEQKELDRKEKLREEVSFAHGMLILPNH